MAFSWKSLFLQNEVLWRNVLFGYIKLERIKCVSIAITRYLYGIKTASLVWSVRASKGEGWECGLWIGWFEFEKHTPQEEEEGQGKVIQA